LCHRLRRRWLYHRQFVGYTAAIGERCLTVTVATSGIASDDLRRDRGRVEQYEGDLWARAKRGDSSQSICRQVLVNRWILE
ncbi:MAG TPA: hypothetical protein VKE27_10970, partial [Candidatus Dormibacteraeota bacterium]|nr:hypothetical protein [Candidatus Dormibacteraeota bacterium]